MGRYFYDDRMRNATILVVNLRGVATETIKNIVLAGIGKLIIWDCEDVAAEDLGVGFFFRDEDVGKKVRLFPPSPLQTSAGERVGATPTLPAELTSYCI
jgi:molybdopterin/thiamine biosynthesis adenylyltransferase